MKIMKKLLVATCVAAQVWFPAVVNGAETESKIAAATLWPTDLRNFIKTAVETHDFSKLGLASIARARSQAAVLDQPIANPELELSGTNRDTDVQPDGSKPEAERSREIGISLTTDFGVKQAIQRQHGLLDVALAELKDRDRKLELEGEILSALAAYTAAKDEAKMAVRQEQVMGQFIKQAEALRRSGETSATDLSLSKLALAETLRSGIEANSLLEQARIDLETLCRCDSTALPNLPNTLPVFARPDFKKLVAGLPSVRASGISVKKAAVGVRAAKAGRIPDPTFSLNGGTEGKAKFVTVGLSIPLPVLRSGSSEVRAAEAERLEAEQEELAERFVRKRQAMSSFQSYELARRTHELWRTQSITSIEEQSKVLGRLWRTGEIGTTEYLVKIKETIEATKNGVRLKGQAWSALSRWLIDSNKMPLFLGEK